MMTGRLGPPPSRSEIRGNIDTSSKEEKPRFMNVRVTPGKFREIKMAALAMDMTLGEYLLHAHDAYQISRRSD